MTLPDLVFIIQLMMPFGPPVTITIASELTEGQCNHQLYVYSTTRTPLRSFAYCAFET